MLIIISHPEVIAGESFLINGLFDAGMDLFHLRKPGVDIETAGTLMRRIKAVHHPKIVLHQHHDLADRFDIRRLHFPEDRRMQMNGERLAELRKSGMCLSTSIHEVTAYEGLSSCFGYTFFGPVFNSISKPGYHTALPEDFVFPAAQGFGLPAAQGPGLPAAQGFGLPEPQWPGSLAQTRPRAIAIGGIAAGNVAEAMGMGFSGVAALGTLWQKPCHSIRQFKKLQTAWRNYA